MILIFVCLCCFYQEAFHVKSYLARCFHVFSVLFSTVITSLGEESAGLYASRTFVFLYCPHYFFVLFTSSWCWGSTADCDCGTPWTFHLTFCSVFYFTEVSEFMIELNDFLP